MNQSGDVIVVGAGPGGLAAAMLLAHRGFRVKVFEKEDVVGGRSAPIRIGDYVFDTGPTFLMMSYILEEVFHKTGRNVADYLDMVTLEPMYKLQFKNQQVMASFDKKTMENEIEEKFPGSGEKFRLFMREERKRYERLIPCLRRPYPRVTDLLRSDVLQALPYLGVRESLYDVLGKYFGEEELKLSFTFQSKYLGMSPWNCPGAFTIIPYIEQSFGIQHVMGGLNQICHAMARVIKEEGGEIKTGCPVSSLIWDGEKVKGVQLEDGRGVFSDHVVMNADFAYAILNLTGKKQFKKYTPEKIAKMDFSCSTFMLYLGLDKLYDLPHHNISFADDYRKGVEEIFSSTGLSDEISLYIQNASITDPSLAPPGHSALYVLVPVPNNRSDIDWEQEKAPFRQRILDLIKERANLTDLEEHIQAEKVITPADWERDYNVHIGATFNLAHTIRQMLYFRPHNKLAEAEGLYLVGGGTHPGSGLPTIYQSAMISADMISQSVSQKVLRKETAQYAVPVAHN